MKHIVTNRSKRPVPLPRELMPLQSGESREIEISSRKAERLARYGVLSFVPVVDAPEPQPLAAGPVATPFDDEPDEPEARPAEEEPAGETELEGDET